MGWPACGGFALAPDGRCASDALDPRRCRARSPSAVGRWRIVTGWKPRRHGWNAIDRGSVCTVARLPLGGTLLLRLGESPSAAAIFHYLGHAILVRRLPPNRPGCAWASRLPEAWRRLEAAIIVPNATSPALMRRCASSCRGCPPATHARPLRAVDTASLGQFQREEPARLFRRHCHRAPSGGERQIPGGRPEPAVRPWPAVCRSANHCLPRFPVPHAAWRPLDGRPISAGGTPAERPDPHADRPRAQNLAGFTVADPCVGCRSSVMVLNRSRARFYQNFSMPASMRPSLHPVHAGFNRRVEKARGLAADGCIAYLEDAVAEDAKAWRAARSLRRSRRRAMSQRKRKIALNGLTTAWGEADLLAAADMAIDGVVLPKVESAAAVQQAEAKLVAAGASAGCLIWCMLETPLGVLRAQEIASSSRRVGGLIMGTSDLTKDLGAQHVPDRAPLLAALGHCLLAARAFGLTILDGVHLDLADDEFPRRMSPGPRLSNLTEDAHASQDDRRGERGIRARRRRSMVAPHHSGTGAVAAGKGLLGRWQTSKTSTSKRPPHSCEVRRRACFYAMRPTLGVTQRRGDAVQLAVAKKPPATAPGASGSIGLRGGAHPVHCRSRKVMPFPR